MKNDYIVIFSNLGNIKGSINSIIIDFKRDKFFKIPNEIYDIFENGFVKLTDFKNIFDTIEIFNEYLNFFINNELGFITKNPSNFPVINKVFERPYFADILYIEIDDLQSFKVDFLKSNLEEIGISHLILIYSNGNQFDFLKNAKYVISLCKSTKIQHITFFLKHNLTYDYTIIDNLFNEDNRILLRYLPTYLPT